MLTSYTPGHSGYVNDVFRQYDGFGDQPYSPGYGADMETSGYWALETGITNLTASQIMGSYSSAQFTNWKATQDSFVAGMLNKIAPYPNLRYFGQADALVKNTPDLWPTTRSYMATTWATPLMTYAVSGNWQKLYWIDMADEVQDAWNHKPLQGPIMFNGGAQSGLTSIVASGGDCTVNWTAQSINNALHFIISGATTSGFNSVAPATYTATSRSANSFHFACSVANGTYNETTDPFLMIEPYAVQWFNSNTDYVRYDAFNTVRTQVLAASPRPLITWPNSAGTNCASIANWEGNGTQSIGGNTQVSDYATIYTTNPGWLLYTANKSSTFTMISSVGDFTRAWYGCFDPDKPLILKTESTPVSYGFQGYSVAVASMSGGLMTFSSPHNIPIVYPGITRLWWNSKNYYVASAPSPTTLRVVLANEDFSGTGTGGTITFQNGDTKALTSISASTSAAGKCSSRDVTGGAYIGLRGTLCGSTLSYTGSGDSNVNRHRGQTFTIAGNSLSGFNTHTFFFDIENVDSANASPGYNFYREVPDASYDCSSSCPAATIVADNYYIAGRQGNTSTDSSGESVAQPGMAFSGIAESWIVRGAGQRMYKEDISWQGYLESAGFMGLWNNNHVFQDANASNQAFVTTHFENAMLVPVFWANSLITKFAQRWAKFMLQPPLPSPDYGPLIEACARGGPNGNIVFVANMTDGAQTRTFSLTPYQIAGQSIIRSYVAPDGTWTITTLAPGTATDSFTLAANAAIAYIFPATYAGELSQPTISVRLADVTNAARVLVRYGYNPYFFDTSLDNVFDCGASAACTLPVDRQVGTVYYRIYYLDSGGRTLATGAVQQL